MADENKDEIETPEIKNKKVKFDAEQMVVVNGLYSEAWAKARQKADEEYQAKLAAEEAERKRIAEEKEALAKELETLKKSTAKPEEKPEQKPEQKPAEVDVAQHPAFKQLAARFEEMQNIFTTVKQERDTLKAETDKARAERIRSRKKDSFLTAMKDAGISFFDPLEAYRLAEDEGLEYDETNERVIVKNAATGVAKLNENGEPMNAVDFVKDFASRKKYLVKAPDQKGGTGASESEVQDKKDKTDTKDYSKMTREEFEAERQKVLSKQR